MPSKAIARDRYNTFLKEMRRAKPREESLKLQPLTEALASRDFTVINGQVPIAQGRQAAVYKHPEKNPLYAIKRYKLEEREPYEKELGILEHIKRDPHPYLVNMIQHEENEFGLHIVLPWYGALTLDKWLVSAPEEQDNDDTKISILIGNAAATHHLHTVNDIAHKDLKCNNILTTMPSRILLILGSVPMSPQGVHGTTPFIAPEVFRDARQIQKQDWKRVDIYAMGVIIYAVVTNRVESQIYQTLADIDSRVIRGERPFVDNMENHPAKKLILACWDIDHARRPDAFRILQTLIAIQFKSASLRNGFCGPLIEEAQCEHNELLDGIRAVRNGHLEPIEDNAVFSATIHLGFVTTAVALCSLEHRLLTKPRVQWLPYNSFGAPLTGLLAQWLSTRSSEQCLEALTAFVQYAAKSTPVMIKVVQHYRTVLQRHGMAIWKVLLHPGARSTISYDNWTHKDRFVFQQGLIPVIDQMITIPAYRDAILAGCETWVINSLHNDNYREVYALSDLVRRVIHLCVSSYALPDPAMFVKAFHKCCEAGEVESVKCLFLIPGITENKDESGRNGLQLAFMFGKTDVFHLLRNVMSSSVENLDFNFDSWSTYEDMYQDAPPTHFVRTILQKYPELVHSIVTPDTLAQLCTPGISEKKELASTLKLLRKWVVARHYICSDPRPFLRIMFTELCRNGRYYALKWLLRHHPELVSTNDIEGNSGLPLACTSSNEEAGDAVKLLYRKGQRLPVNAPGIPISCNDSSTIPSGYVIRFCELGGFRDLHLNSWNRDAQLVFL